MPRAGLSPAVVVAEAARLVDEGGWERLTLQELAGRLGVRLPSLYKHIESLESLRDDIGLVALRELEEALTSAAVGRSGPDALRAVAHAYRAYAQAHPGRYAATIRAPNSREEERTKMADSLLKLLRAVLAGYGLEGDAVVHAIRILRAGLHGFVSLEAAGSFGTPEDVEITFDLLILTLHESLARRTS
jgi:AcrR family transcriptional regulator